MRYNPLISEVVRSILPTERSARKLGVTTHSIVILRALRRSPLDDMTVAKKSGIGGRPVMDLPSNTRLLKIGYEN
jgi:hypothetical protein